MTTTLFYGELSDYRTTRLSDSQKCRMLRKDAIQVSEYYKGQKIKAIKVKKLNAQIYSLIGISALLFTTSLAYANDDSTVSFITGLDYYGAGYTRNGTERATIIPAIFKYNDGNRLSADLNIPYLRYTAPQNVTPGIGAINGGSNIVTTRDGIGDTKAGVTYAIFTKPWTELTGIIKIPTASTKKELGTGEADYTVQIATYPKIGIKRIQPYFWGGYKFYGSPPGQHLNNTYFASAGADYKFNDKNGFGLGVDYQQGRTDTQLPDRLVNAHFSHSLGRATTFAIQLQKSFLRSTTSWTVGAALHYQFDIKKPKS